MALKDWHRIKIGQYENKEKTSILIIDKNIGKTWNFIKGNLNTGERLLLNTGLTGREALKALKIYSKKHSK